MQLLTPDTLNSLPAAIRPRLVNLFASTTPTLLTSIRDHATHGDLTAMAQAAHKLKGSCVGLGAQQMADICKTLQHKGETGDTSEIQALSQTLEQLYPATLAQLQTLV